MFVIKRPGDNEDDIQCKVDAHSPEHLIIRRTREFSEKDIGQIAATYHNWRNADGDYEDVPGFCKSAPIERVRELDYVLTPGRYVGLAAEVDDFDFEERFVHLQAEFADQLAEETRLNTLIQENLSKVKFTDG